MLELSEEGRWIVDALLRAPVAWLSPRELSLAIDRDLEETTDQIAALDVGGWLSAWEREFDVVMTLSVAAASILGVRLVEYGQQEIPRWARQDEPEPSGLRASGVFRGELAAAMELVVDPSLSAEEALERAEAVLARLAIPPESRLRPSIESLPAPTLLIGVGLSPWPGPGEGSEASCPCCGSKPLKPSMYCLRCDRWGLDHLLKAEPSTRHRRLPDPKEEASHRELERQTRKVKRRARRLAQSQAERRSKRRPRQVPR